MIKESLRYFRIKFFKYLFKSQEEFKITNKSCLIIAPHPDDEIFGCGGLILKKLKLNSQVYILYLTNGEKSLKNFDKTDIIINRKRAINCITNKLRFKKENIFFYNLSDGNIPRKNDKEFNNAIKNLKKLIESLQIKEIYVPYFLEGWSDHIAAYEMGKELKKLNKDLDLFFYWVWSLYYLNFKSLKKIEWNSVNILNIERTLKYKKELIECYLNIKTSNGLPYVGDLPKNFLRIFNFCFEIYIKG